MKRERAAMFINKERRWRERERVMLTQTMLFKLFTNSKLYLHIKLYIRAHSLFK